MAGAEIEEFFVSNIPEHACAEKLAEVPSFLEDHVVWVREFKGVDIESRLFFRLIDNRTADTHFQ